MKLLKFYASWCAPCKMLSSVIDEVDVKMPIVEINIDTDTDTAIKYGIRGVPTLIVVDENENEVARKSGVMNKAQLEAFLPKAE